MTEVKTVINELKTLSMTINRIIRQTGYAEFGDMSELNVDRTIADDFFIIKELSQIIESLSDVQSDINYLASPIRYESPLHINTYGKYETNRDDVYSCGKLIEYLSHDEDYHEYPFWRKSRVEHNSEGYYIVGEANLSLSGVTVRIRGN